MRDHYEEKAATYLEVDACSLGMSIILKEGGFRNMCRAVNDLKKMS